MQHFGLAALFCSTLLLSACRSTSALPSDTGDHAQINEQSFLMSLIGKLSQEALKLNSDVKGSSELMDSEIQQEVSCPDSLPNCDTKPRYKSCTGIALDTTHSMQPEIDLTRKILIEDLNTINAVYDSGLRIPYCYAFVEVNHYLATPDPPVADFVATSDDHPRSLNKLIEIVQLNVQARRDPEAVNRFPPHAENRTLRHWEEQFKAIRKLQIKKRTDDNSVSLMKDGQIVLITNSNTWDNDLLNLIVNTANEDNTCFSMFIPEYATGRINYEPGNVLTDPNADGVNYYEQLVNALKTTNRIGDVQLDPPQFRHINFAEFLTVRAGTQCGGAITQPEIKQPERTGSEPYPYCGSVTVNPLTSILRIVAAGEGDSSVKLRVTSPDSKDELELRIPIQVPRDATSSSTRASVTTFRRALPAAGVWTVCGNRQFTFFVGHVPAIEARPSYRVYNACDDQQLFETEPKQCSIGQASFCTNVNNLPQQIASAKLVTRRKENSQFEITDSHDLEFCNNAFYSDSFRSPDQEGSYKFTIEGLDINNKEYVIDVGTTTLRSTIPFKVTVSPTEFTNLTVGDSFEVKYTVTSLVDYCFSVSVTPRETAGIELGSSPQIMELSPQDSKWSFTLSMKATGEIRPPRNIIPLAFDAVVSTSGVEIGGCPLSVMPGILVNIIERTECETECALQCIKGHECRYQEVCYKVQMCVDINCAKCSKDCPSGQRCVLVDGVTEQCALVF